MSWWPGMPQSTETTVRERREADPAWVRRRKRSLGKNKQYRRRVRMDHEARKKLDMMVKDAEKQKNDRLALLLKSEPNEKRLLRRLVQRSKRGG